MSTLDGSDPIADDEMVLRRISHKSGWYDPELDRPLGWQVFKPNDNDVGGISVWRAKYVTPETAVRIGARYGRQYYVAILNVGRLRRTGLEIIASPEEGGPGHASLVNLSVEHYRSDKNTVRTLAETITALLIERVEGPFGPFDADLE